MAMLRYIRFYCKLVKHFVACNGSTSTVIGKKEVTVGKCNFNSVLRLIFFQAALIFYRISA
jgi:hypothetical protein